MSQQHDTLRQSIAGILRNCNMTEPEKSREIQCLMDARSDSKSSVGINSRLIGPSPTYHNSTKQILGCPHYQTKAKLLAPCCNAWIPCRFCHNEECGHAVDRFAIETMKCMICNEEQPIAQQCTNCMEIMGKYYCSKCRLIDDGPCKQVFHCDKCGICLSGCSSDYYHCLQCDACVATSARDRHSCSERILHSNCPICCERFFDSTYTVVQTTCKHLIHKHCLETSIRYSYKCPLCFASLCDTHSIFNAIDDYMSISIMLPEYEDMVSSIFCNDCHQRSVAKFHFLYHKCGQCSSYNTIVVS
ncbi:zf-CHY-domain-containing protein [Coemansia reversa NRRL 1564]|uniref:Zf-CHY-domain-containing protein n=1 Tax=Coemansia reversa (strain ATCC 12441 / NRRL 1564) TaxID=763665 RepID=A0A2G5BJ43_COERN|nr:zf-CHY-domain-containing protein [Coemansia reversa NRRL 1564]|eukprot:PIA19038.1 zf-CHY-domain-containing protein [Coemansia reversa NRRL 1564]